MDNPVNKKTVYLNGRAIGAVESVGNLDQDAEAARQLLKDKGVYREVSSIQAMYNQAYSFAQTSSYLYDRDLTKVPRNGFSLAPFVVNAAFGIELYLKTLAKIYGVTLKVHELLKLYDALPNVAKSRVRNAIPACARDRCLPDDIDFRQCIAEVNNAFVQWRYVYERSQSKTIQIQHLIFVMHVLHEVCSQSKELK